MSVKRHLCRSGRTIRPSTQHIWIGDDILDAAIERFGRFSLFKRNVGFAPGPLEARKRGSRRRLAYISQGNVTAGDTDPSLLSGVNERAQVDHWSWQSPDLSQLSRRPPSSSWPSAFLQPPRPPPNPVEEQNGGGPDITPGLRGRDEEIHEDQAAIMKKLGYYHNLDELRNLTAFHSIDVRRYSQQIFRRLWEATKSIKVCLEFLENDHFDAPWAQNLDFLLGEVSQDLNTNEDTRRLSSETRLTLIPWIKVQLSLGTMSSPDIEALTLFIRELSSDDKHKKRLSHRAFEIDKKRRIHLAISILEGLQACTVQAFSDFAPATRHSLLEAITVGYFPVSLQKAGLSLLAKSTEDPDIVSQYLVKCFRSSSTYHSMTSDDGQWESKVIPKIEQLLRDRPWRSAESIIKITNKTMVEWQAELPQDPSDKPGEEPPGGFAKIWRRVLYHWWALPWRCIPLDSVEDWDDSLKIPQSGPSDDIANLAACAKHFSDDDCAKFVFSHWFFGRLPIEKFRRTYPLVEDILQSQATGSSFFHMLRIVHEQLDLQDDFVRHVFHFLTQLKEYLDVKELIYKSDTINMYIPPDVFQNLPPNVVQDAIQQVLGLSIEKAYDIFACDPRQALESFPALADYLIRDTRTHPNRVWLVRRVRRQPHKNGDETDYLNARYHLLNTMALSFSEVRHLTLRMVQRNIGKCLNTVRREDLGYLSESMLIAMMRSTIVRPLQETGKVSTQAVQNLLGRIREVEGPEPSDYIDRVVSYWQDELEKVKVCEQECGPMRYKFHREWLYDLRQFEILMIPLNENPDGDTRPSYRRLSEEEDGEYHLPLDPSEDQDQQAEGYYYHSILRNPDAPAVRTKDAAHFLYYSNDANTEIIDADSAEVTQMRDLKQSSYGTTIQSCDLVTSQSPDSHPPPTAEQGIQS